MLPWKTATGRKMRGTAIWEFHEVGVGAVELGGGFALADVHGIVAVVFDFVGLAGDDGHGVGALLGGFDPEFAMVADGLFERGSAEPGEDEEDEDGGEAGDEDGELAVALLFGGVAGAGDEALFAEDFLEEEVAEEVGAVALPDAAFGEGIDGDAEDFGEFGIEGGAFGHGGGEVDAAEEEGLGGPFAGDEDHFEVAAEARADLGDGFGEGVEGIDLVDAAGVGVFGVDGVLEEAAAAVGEALADDSRGGWSTCSGSKAVVEGVGVGPAHDLVLELGVVEVVEEFAEAVEEVALGDDDEDGEADAEGALDLSRTAGRFCWLSSRWRRRCP